MKNTDKEKKKRFNELLLATGRDGIEYVIEELDDMGFYEAPASGCHHLNERGGLLTHSLNVYDEAMAIAGHLTSVMPGLKYALTEDSITLAALLHDVCKADNYRKSVRSRKLIDGSWERYDCFEAGRSSFPCGHGEKSAIQLLKWGLDLSDEEILAIRWHMGPWDLAMHSTEQTGCIDRSSSMYPLVGVIQSADYLATKIIEKA